MLRLIAVPAIILTVLFSVMMSFIPSFAPETSALSYYELTPDREQAIYLRDVRSGLSYFTGLVTRSGNFSMWSADGTTIATLNSFPGSLDILDLTTGYKQSYPLRAPNGFVEWINHPKKIAYSSAIDRGSLMIYDRETGEEQSYLLENAIRWMRWIPDSESLIVSASPQSDDRAMSLYAIDLTTNDIRLLIEDFNGSTFEVLNHPLRIIYYAGNQVIVYSPDDPDAENQQITFADGDISAMGLMPDMQNVIVYTSMGETWLVDVETHQRELFREAPTENGASPALWSPDGELYATLQRENDNNSTIQIVRRGEQVDLIFNEPLSRLMWSPDSRYLLATSLYTAPVTLIDTTNGNVEIMENTYNALFWQPEGE